MSKLQGEYIRTKITNWNYSLNKHEDISHLHPINNIRLEYNGDGEYKGTAYYGEDKVDITINLDRLNTKTGKGIYQYNDKTDLGTYDVQIHLNNPNKIYINYFNVISVNSETSGLARGYEIWERPQL